MIIYVDIDETICVTPPDRDYTKSTPIKKTLKKLMISMTRAILLFIGPPAVRGQAKTTAEITQKQMKEWFHELKLENQFVYFDKA